MGETSYAAVPGQGPQDTLVEGIDREVVSGKRSTFQLGYKGQDDLMDVRPAEAGLEEGRKGLECGHPLALEPVQCLAWGDWGVRNPFFGVYPALGIGHYPAFQDTPPGQQLDQRFRDTIPGAQ